jgi:competence protein CoiA
MFIAKDHHGNSVNPIDTIEEELRLLSRSKLLFCPECQTVVRFYSGEIVTAHFKHVNNPECTNESEPETEEHVKGKILIRNWLKAKYPSVQVEFEYKVIETNQRADVMAIFPSGAKVAFEMQCSKIQGSVWKERHQLYQKAGIKDFWILGQSVHKYGKTGGNEDLTKHQLVSLASTIYKEENSLLFLDTETVALKGLYFLEQDSWHSDTILVMKEKNFQLDDAVLYKEFIGTEEIKKRYDRWLKDKILQEKRAKKLEELRIKEEERQKQEFERKQQIKLERIERHLNELETFSFDTLKQKMTKKEVELFERLLWKHEYKQDNFPGIFNVYTEHNMMIQTPHQLWQFWIYDRYIHGRKQILKKIWVPNIQKDMEKMYSKGIFRITSVREESHFSFAIYNYIVQLGLFEILIQLGHYKRKYHEILCDCLPPLTGIDVHRDLAYYLSTVKREFLSSTKLLPEIQESVNLYTNMIKACRESEPASKPQPKISDMKLLSIVDYTNNLIQANEMLANEWESSFVSNLYLFLLKGNSITEKQIQSFTKIKVRVEKELGISLTYQ